MLKKVNKLFQSPKLQSENISLTLKSITNKDPLLVKWSASEETRNNFGDALNPYLIEKMTGKKPLNSNKLINITNRKVYGVIGSILDNNKDKNLEVWGSGFKSKDSMFISKPKKIHAIRGPLSRKIALNQGVECPEIYGDPALLLPMYYNPSVKKEYKLGVIAHYIDKKSERYLEFQRRLPSNVLIIDIESDIEELVDNVIKCERIISSSLHGIIVADAYNIPSLFVKFSDNVVGGDFKFRDYMASVHREYKGAININETISLEYLLDSFEKYEIKIDLEKLLKACPFIETKN